MAMRSVVLLCNDGCTSRLVAQTLAKEKCLVAILVTSPSSLKKRLKWRIKKLGLIAVASQVACAISAKILYKIRGGELRKKSILAAMDLTDAWPNNVQRMALPAVNSEATVAALKALKPDMVVVNGTDIIKAAVLTCLDVPFVNIHCGITPDYRGVHGAFWALWESQPERLGVTLHYVDEGVDSGRIISQAQITYDPAQDGFLNLPLLQYQAALPLLKDFILSDTAHGALAPPKKSKQWFYPGVSHYLLMLLTGKVRY